MGGGGQVGKITSGERGNNDNVLLSINATGDLAQSDIAGMVGQLL